jgi:hypothetical protein
MLRLAGGRRLPSLRCPPDDALGELRQFFRRSGDDPVLTLLRVLEDLAGQRRDPMLVGRDPNPVRGETTRKRTDDASLAVGAAARVADVVLGTEKQDEVVAQERLVDLLASPGVAVVADGEDD